MCLGFLMAVAVQRATTTPRVDHVMHCHATCVCNVVVCCTHNRWLFLQCGHGEACTRNICFFAHNPTELRNPATAGVDDPLAAELAAATGPFQQLAIGPQLTAGSSSSGSQQPQLVYAEPGGACSIGSGAASSSGAAMTALQASQALQAVQVVGIAGQQQQQVLFPTPAAASDSLLQPTMVPAAGTPGYQQHTSSVMPTGPGIMTLAASQQAPQQSGQALQWGYEQPQLQQQMMLGAAGLHSAVAMQPQVGTAGGSVFAQAAGMGPAVVQQQIMPAPGVPYYSMPGAGYPMMFGQAVPQQQYPQSQYAQQAYPQQQQQQQQVYYPHQATMLMMPQANQPAGPGSGVAARYIPAVGAVDQPVVSVLQPSTGVGHLTGRPGPVMQMYTPPGPAQLSQQHPQQLAGGSATPPASAAEQQYLVPHW